MLVWLYRRHSGVLWLGEAASLLSSFHVFFTVSIVICVKWCKPTVDFPVLPYIITVLRQPATKCTVPSFLSPAVLQHNPAPYHIPAVHHWHKAPA